MYLSELSESEKLVFLALARRMIAADDILSPEEQEMLGDLMAEMQIQEVDHSDDRDLPELCEAITGAEEQAYALLELASVAHIDGSYADQERQLFRSISKLWGIDPLTVIRVEDWATSRIELSRTAADVINEISSPIGHTQGESA